MAALLSSALSGEPAHGAPKPSAAAEGTPRFVDFFNSPNRICGLASSGVVTCLERSELNDHAPPSFRDLARVEGARQVRLAYKRNTGDFVQVLRENGEVVFLDPERTVLDRPAKSFLGRCIIDEEGSGICDPSLDNAVPNVVHAAVARNQACFVKDDGDVECHGSGGIVEDVQVFLDSQGRPAEPRPASAVTVGRSMACALLRSGEVDCWGAVDSLGHPTERPVRPHGRRPIEGLADVVELSADPFGTYVCALDRKGEITCFGEGLLSKKQAGLYKLPAVPGAHRLQVATQRVCVLDHAGELKCIGAVFTPRPVTVEGVSDVIKLISNSKRVCALTKANEVLCWGIVDGQGLTRPVVVATGIISISDFPVDGQSHDFCGITTGKTVSCFKTRDENEARIDLPGLDGVEQVVAESEHVCARTAEGAVWCWGTNRHKQLGVSEPSWVSFTDPPVQVAGLPPVIDLSAKRNGNCVVTKEHRVLCWGQVPNLTAAGSPTEPKPVHELEFLRGVHVERILLHPFREACALDIKGIAHCWGLTHYPTPSRRLSYERIYERVVQVPGIDPARFFLGRQACSATRESSLYCFGDSPIHRWFAPANPDLVPIWTVKDFTSVTSTDDVICFAQADGGVKCAGSNVNGTVGWAIDDWVDPFSLR